MKEFKQKCHFINHVEKKKIPCKPITIHPQISCNVLQNPVNILQTPTNLLQKNEDNTKKYTCNFCEKTFTRIDNFKVHLTSRCKIRKEETKDKEEIFKDLLQKYEEMKNMMVEKDEKINIMMKEKDITINNLTKEIELLKQTKNKSSRKTINNNNNTTNNNNNTNNGSINNGIVNNTINIIQHGKEDLSKISNDVLINALLQNTGIKIPEKIIESIHFNDKYPQFKNIYISDINREKVMLHNGDKWILTHSDDITTNLLDKSIIFSEDRYEEIGEKIEQKVDVKTKNKIKKGLEMIDMIKDFDEIDEEDEEGNLIDKKVVKRRKGLRTKAIQNIKLLLYNNRNKVIE